MIEMWGNVIDFFDLTILYPISGLIPFFQPNQIGRVKVLSSGPIKRLLFLLLF